MEETASRKLHPVLEVLIISAVMLGIIFLFSWLISPHIMYFVKNALFLYQLLSFAINMLAPFLGGVLCFRVIEKRPIRWWVLLLIAAGYQLLTYLPSVAITSYLATFGDSVLAGFAKVRVYIAPVLEATVMTLVIRLLFAPKSEDTPPVQIRLVSHVLLLLFTFGIWNLIWIYRVTRYLNCVPDEPYRNPATKLLLCMFVPFYSIYWVYKSAQRIDRLANTVGVVSDLAVVCLILEIFVPLVPPILMQDKINKILEA